MVRALKAMAVAGGVGMCFAAGFLLSHDLRLASGSAHPRTKAEQRQETLSAVRGALLAGYVLRLDARRLPQSSVPAVLRTLHDPYTVYYSPAEYAAVRADLASAYVGIGVRVTPDARGLRVVAAMRGSPAARHGVTSGDSIVAIDGVSTRGLAFDAALSRLDGLAGTRVAVRILHIGRADPVEMRLVRIRLHPDAVTTQVRRVHGQRILVIHIASFSHGVAARVRQLVRHQHAVVLDLRGDPGGLVEEAVSTADVFVRAGRIVSWRGAHVPEHEVLADGSAVRGLRLAVVVDGNTASAAEILAGALQDHHRALVYGSRTYGKASMQVIEPLADGGALKLTVATYRTPVGRDLAARGVQPDVTAGRGALRRATSALAR